ncbi:MAG: GNAT family N-acetyltransferase, partial [Terriglobia bacterium]
MIRICVQPGDVAQVCEVINDGAFAYKGSIPADCWVEPYMAEEELARELKAGVAFWGYESAGALAGVMGIQDVGDVTLVRHAYVRTRNQKQGIGGKLLAQLRSLTRKPVLIGTWADAVWAIRFYQKHGFRLVPGGDKDKLLGTYWTISKRQT